METPDWAIDNQPNPAISRLSPKPLDFFQSGLLVGGDPRVIADALGVRVHRAVGDRVGIRRNAGRSACVRRDCLGIIRTVGIRSHRFGVIRAVGIWSDSFCRICASGVWCHRFHIARTGDCIGRRGSRNSGNCIWSCSANRRAGHPGSRADASGGAPSLRKAYARHQSEHHSANQYFLHTCPPRCGCCLRPVKFASGAACNCVLHPALECATAVPVQHAKNTAVSAYNLRRPRKVLPEAVKPAFSLPPSRDDSRPLVKVVVT